MKVLRRATVAVIIATSAGAAVSIAVAAPRSGPSAAAGSGFGSLGVTAVASAVRAPFYSNGGEDVEGEVPYAESQLTSGLSGHALTSVAWPGGTGASGGTTLYLLGPQCVPPNPTGVLPLPCPTTLPQGPQSTYDKLNDNEKAEAQTGAGKPTDTNSSNGVVQSATARPTLVTAQTSVKGSKVPAVGEAFGQTSAATKVSVTGPKTVRVTASSTVHDVSLAGGVIKFGSVSSVAEAVSNTKTGTGHAFTTVSDATIAGVPVTIDQTGVHLKGTSSPLPSTSPVNKALSQSGVQIFVAKPSKQIKNADVSVDSGNVIVLFSQSQYVKNANDTGALLILGGASITANTGKGALPPPVMSTPTTPPTHAAPAPARGGGGGAAAPPTGGGGAPAGPAGSVPTGGSGAQPPAVAPAPQLAAQGINLPGGMALIWVILGLMAVGGLAYGLKRLPDGMLRTTGPACPLEDGGS